MSEENLEIVRRMYEEAKTRPEALFEFLDEEIEWDTSALDMAGTAEGRGRETVRTFFRTWTGAFEEWEYEADELMETGDVVIARIRQRGRGRTSGVGKAIRSTHHREKAEALEAAGLL